MKNKSKKLHNSNERSQGWFYAAILFFNVLIFIGIGMIYATYAHENSKKLYNENLNNVANLNAASANSAEMYFESMVVKIEDIAGYIQRKELSYDEAVKYLGECNTTPDCSLQLVLCAHSDETGSLVRGDYFGVSLRRIAGEDGTPVTKKTEVDYRYNYRVLHTVLDDLSEESLGQTGFAPVFTDADTRLKCISVYRRIIFKDEHGADTYYTLFLTADTEKAQSIYNLQNDYSGQSTVLVNEAGNYIIKNNEFKGENFYEYLQSYNSLSLDKRIAIRESIINSENENGSVKYLFYNNYNGEECVFCISRMSNEWYGITCVPVSSFHIDDAGTNYSLIMLIIFLLLFAVDAVVVYLIGKAMKYNVTVAEKAQKEADEANRAKSRFLSTMSHELRTPLNAIIGLVALAGDSMDNPTVLNDYLKKIDISSKLLLHLISDILDVSAIESDKMKLSFTEFDLSKLISSLTSIYYDQCASKGIEFRVDLNNLSVEKFVGDSLRVNQILLNFLSNAVKFTPRGGSITLRVVQEKREDDVVTIRFDVIDTGCGVSEDLKKRLFKPFEQESGNTTKKYGGTGLGLSIAKNLAELMGGRVEMESTESHGSRFSAIIPFSVAQERVNKDYSPFGSMNILVAISESSTRNYIGQILNSFGVEHTLADSVEAAIETLKANLGTNPFNMCILDWKMSDYDAVSATKMIHAEPGLGDVKILVLSYDLPSARLQYIEAGVNAIIAKPVFPSSLYNDLASIATGNRPAISLSPNKDYNFSGKRVLLVEDNALNVEIASLLLKKNKLSVEVAQDGLKGYEAFLNSPKGYFDAILMDVQMPVMNGYEATAEIRRSSHPQAKTIPILAMTADAFSEDVERGLKVGMDAHLPKPIEPDILFSTLKEFLLP